MSKFLAHKGVVTGSRKEEAKHKDRRRQTREGIRSRHVVSATLLVYDASDKARVRLQPSVLYVGKEAARGTANGIEATYDIGRNVQRKGCSLQQTTIFSNCGSW
jgi:hypothetical protein